jgi:hypothetical protein
MNKTQIQNQIEFHKKQIEFFEMLYANRPKEFKNDLFRIEVIKDQFHLYSIMDIKPPHLYFCLGRESTRNLVDLYIKALYEA